MKWRFGAFWGPAGGQNGGQKKQHIAQKIFVNVPYNIRYEQKSIYWPPRPPVFWNTPI
jgi:hypothetical protein